MIAKIALFPTSVMKFLCLDNRLEMNEEKTATWSRKAAIIWLFREVILDDGAVSSNIKGIGFIHLSNIDACQGSLASACSKDNSVGRATESVFPRTNNGA